MQKDIHPKVAKLEIQCSTCQTKYEIMTTTKQVAVDVCKSCHPFYTGDRSMVKSTGQVDKFNKRFAKRATTKK